MYMCSSLVMDDSATSCFIKDKKYKDIYRYAVVLKV